MHARNLAIGVVTLLVLLAGCAGGTDSGESAGQDLSGGGGDGSVRGQPVADKARVGVGQSLDASGDTGAIAYSSGGSRAGDATLNQAGTGGREVSPALPVGPSIIKTASVRLSIEGNNFARAVHTATTVAERYGGYVVSTTVDEEGKGFAAATLRVPADKFGAAMGAVRGVGTVESEEITGEDVTQQVIDLEARLRHLKSQEIVLLRLMDDARSVMDTIRIQEHLSDVQLEIERLRGRLRYLDDQVSFSTIFVEMRQAGDGDGPQLGVIGRAWHRALDAALSVLGTTIVAFGFAIPVAIMLAFLVLAYRMLRPRLRRVPTVG